MDQIYQLKYFCSVVLHLRDVYVLVFLQSGGASGWRVCYQGGLPRLVYAIISTVQQMKMGHVCHVTHIQQQMDKAAWTLAAGQGSLDFWTFHSYSLAHFMDWILRKDTTVLFVLVFDL